MTHLYRQSKYEKKRSLREKIKLLEKELKLSKESLRKLEAECNHQWLRYRQCKLCGKEEVVR